MGDTRYQVHRWLLRNGGFAMVNDTKIDCDVEEDVLVFEVSDEALEAAADMGTGAASYSMNSTQCSCC
jgi:hypothetical protein